MLLATNWISCPVSDHSFNVWSGGTNEQNDKSDGGFAAGSILYRRLFAAWNGTPAPVSGTPNATLTALFDLSKPPATAQPNLSPPTSIRSASHGRAAHPGTVTTSTPPVLPTTAVKTPAATQARSGTLMKVGFLTTAPTIDGSWSEWRDKTTLYPLASVVWGAGNWTDQTDLQASYGAAWDDTNLYVGFKIFDDKYVQNATGKDLYKGDSVELLIDTNLNGDLAVQQLNSDDFQVGLSCGNPEKGVAPEAYLWFPSGKEGSKTSYKVACVFESGLYRVEASIPWEKLGVSPSKDLILGFAASVNDNDDASAKCAADHAFHCAIPGIDGSHDLGLGDFGQVALESANSSREWIPSIPCLRLQA